MSTDRERIDDFWGEPAQSGGLTAWDRGAEEAAHRRTVAMALVTLAGLALGVFSLMIGFRSAQGLTWLLIFAIVLAGFLLLYRNFQLGIVVFIGICWIGIETPAVATGGSGMGKGLQPSQIGLGALLFVWATRMFLRREWSLYRMPINRPILIFLLVCAWSTLNSFLFRDSHVVVNSVRQFAVVNIIEIVIRVLALGALLMAASCLQGRMLRAAAFMVILPGVATYTGVLSFIPASEFLAFPQIIAMSLLAAFAISGRGALWLRILCAVIAFSILGTYLLKGTSWVTGWAGAITALGIVLFLGNRRLFWIACAAIAVIVVSMSGYFYQHVIAESLESGDMHRFDMMRSAARYAMLFPLGIGLGNYRSYNTYYGQLWGTHGYTSAHGTYSQALAETGLLGLLALLWLLIAVGVLLYRTWRRLPPGFARAYALGTFGSFVGIAAVSLIGDYLFPAYHNGGLGTFGSVVYTFFAVGVALSLGREQGIVWGSATEEAPKAPERPAPLILRPLSHASGPGTPHGEGGAA